MVITDGSNQVKMSELDRSFSRPALEKKFNEVFKHSPDQSQKRGVIATVRAARKLDKAIAALDSWHKGRGQMDALYERRAEVMKVTQPAADRISKVNELKESTREAWKGIYRDPNKANERFLAVQKKIGLKKAMTQLHKKPQSFGEAERECFAGYATARGSESCIKGIPKSSW